MGSEKIHRDMSKRFEGQRASTDELIAVIKLDKSGGCVDRDEKSFMKPTREAAMREYFFGDAKRTLSPHIQQVDFSALTLYQIRECKASSPPTKTPSKIKNLASETSEFMAPDMENAVDEKIYIKLEPSPSLKHSILAVMHARVFDAQEAIRDASVMGFVYVADVDTTKKKVKFLTPSMGKIGDRPLVLGSWPEGLLSLLG